MKTPITAGRVFSQLSYTTIIKVIAALTVMHNSEKECRGGILAILVQGPEGSTLESRELGAPGEKAFDSAYFAHEKIRRLATRRLTAGSEGEYASSQSADPEKGQYGGCVVSWHGKYEIFISFSGAPAVVDEVVTYVVAEALGFTVSTEYQNDLLPQARALLERCRRP
ncbi:MAG: hypothetical protein V4469_02545 [Patescibacteria group bacterium]